MSYYRWGILGTGAIAHKFAAGLRGLPHARLHSVYSRTYDKARDFALKFGFRHTFKSLESFLGDQDLEIVYIATPNHLHHDLAIRCMEAGKHVLIEKPLALSVSQGRNIELTAARTNRFCMEAMWSRFFPVYLEVRNLLRKNSIGNIRYFSGDFGEPWTYNPHSRIFDLNAGGGCLMDLGVYPISLTLMLLGTPESVDGICRKSPSGTDVLDRFFLHFEDGALADLGCSFNCRLSNSIVITGERGMIIIPGPIYSPDRFKIRQYTPRQFQQTPVTGFRDRLKELPVVSDLLPGIRRVITEPLRSRRQTKVMNYKSNGYHYEAREVMNVLDRGGRESGIMPLHDSLAVLEITDQLRKKWGISFPEADQNETS